MDFRIWWDFYHVNSLIYPDNQEFKGLIFSGVEHLSCLKCQQDAYSYFKRHYWNSNSASLFKLHNNINIRLKKKTLQWDEMVELYKYRSPKQLLDLQWKFIMMMFKVTLSPNKILDFFTDFLKFFNFDVTYDAKLLLSPQNQFYIYSIYINLGGSVPFEEMVLINKNKKTKTYIE